MREHPFGFTKMFQIKARDIVTRILDIVRPRGRPRCQSKLKRIIAHHHRFLPTHRAGRPRAERRANARHFQLGQPVDALANYPFIGKSQEPVRRRPIVKEMFTRAFPDKVRGMRLIYAHQSFASAGPGGKRARVSMLFSGPLINHHVIVLPGFRWHKTNPEQRAIVAVAEPIHRHHR